MATKIFVNLPVNNLDNSMNFFSRLGFTFNPQFTDGNAACMVIGDNIYAMLLVEAFFKTFHKKAIADASQYAEVLIAIDADSREKVDEIVNNAIEAGGHEHRQPQDHGWMYGRSFEDLDGHIWEVLYMDETALPKEMADKHQASALQ